MSTSSKLMFGFTLLILFLIAIGLFVAARLSLVEKALATIMAVQEPATATAYEMALNVNATSAAVVAHVETAEPAHRLRVAANEATFGNLLKRYDEIARSPASRELGTRIRVTQGQQSMLADSLMNSSDQARAGAAGFARGVESVRGILEHELGPQLDGRGRDGARKQAEARRMAADLSDMALAFNRFRETRAPELRARVTARAEDFQDAIAQFGKLRNNDDEKAILARLGPAMTRLLGDAHATMGLVSRVQSLRSRYALGTSNLERLVDDGIHSLARNDLIDAQSLALRSIHFSMIAVLVLMVAAIVIGSMTAVPVGQSIVKSEMALRERMGELAIEHARKDEFLGVLGHELRNPIAPISNSLHVLESRRDEVPSDVRRMHAMMKRQIENMTRLVDDLLDVSRISRGKITLRREPVNLTGLLAQTAEDLRPLLEAGGRKLNVIVSADRLWVDADPTRLAQMLSNLLHNSLKYTEAGGRIGLEILRERGEAVVRLTDDGFGIPPAMLEKIFEPFGQVDPSLTRVHGGLGIGLTLVRRLAEMHGGSVRAESAGLGKGSTFTLRLPLIDAPALPAARPAEVRDGTAGRPVEWMPEPSAAGDREPAARRILVVDDNRDAAESMGDLLRLWGHDVHLAFDGPEALEQAGYCHPELVLLDIGLPGLDGYSVAERLRKESRNGRKMTLIALTGLGQQEDRDRALAAGFDHHLTKPVQPGVLRELIGAAPEARG